MQLPLAIDLHENKTLDNFNWFGNEVLQSQIQQSLHNPNERFFYLWGGAGVGKSHLLQAITKAYGANAIYLPMEQLVGYGKDVFEGMSQLDCICLDNIEQIANQGELEEALFHLYNQLRDNGHSRLYISGNGQIANLGIQLPDLRSRLSWGMVFPLQALPDQQKCLVLQELAQERGFLLPDSVGQYLITHCARDLQALSQIIDKLDKASLAAKRKLTVPFVKTVLGL